jgi:murein DD-endopeptidase MepM/ murein hydrolase activator NlpD
MDRRLKLAMMVAFGALAPMLAACTPDTPETQFAWDANERVERPLPRPHAAPMPKHQTARTYVFEDNGAPVPTPTPRPRYAAARPAPQTNDNDRTDHDEHAPVARPSHSSVAFAWPARGRVISNFGSTQNGERNDGINIAMPEGTPIKAAASGTVSYSGDELKDYGNLLLIKHDGGYVTAYAHADHLLVARGQAVTKGQVIGYVGQTGDVSSPQLHFEIRHNTTPLDPSTVLGGRNS